MNGKIIINEDYINNLKNEREQIENKIKEIEGRVFEIENCCGVKIVIEKGTGIGFIPEIAQDRKYAEQCRYLELSTLLCKLDKENKKCNDLNKYEKKFFGLRTYCICEYRSYLSDAKDLRDLLNRLYKELKTNKNKLNKMSNIKF